MAEITRGWPPKRRKDQAKNIRKSKAWESSTGPKTAEGKRICAQNALKHGLFTEQGQSLLRSLKAYEEILNRL